MKRTGVRERINEHEEIPVIAYAFRRKRERECPDLCLKIWDGRWMAPVTGDR